MFENKHFSFSFKKKIKKQKMDKKMFVILDPTRQDVRKAAPAHGDQSATSAASLFMAAKPD